MQPLITDGKEGSLRTTVDIRSNIFQHLLQITVQFGTSRNQRKTRSQGAQGAGWVTEMKMNN